MFIPGLQCYQYVTRTFSTHLMLTSYITYSFYHYSVINDLIIIFLHVFFVTKITNIYTQRYKRPSCHLPTTAVPPTADHILRVPLPPQCYQHPKHNIPQTVTNIIMLFQHYLVLLTLYPLSHASVFPLHNNTVLHPR